MRTKETTPTWRSRVEATHKAGTRLARLLFFLFHFFSVKVMDKRDNFYFNKTLLSFLLCCFILQSNYLSEPDNSGTNVAEVKRRQNRLQGGESRPMRNPESPTEKSPLPDPKRQQTLPETATSLRILEFTSVELEFQDTKARRRSKEDPLSSEIKQKTPPRRKLKASHESALSTPKSAPSPPDFSHIR